jgi:hypothetical protein
MRFRIHPCHFSLVRLLCAIAGKPVNCFVGFLVYRRLMLLCERLRPCCDGFTPSHLLLGLIQEMSHCT